MDVAGASFIVNGAPDAFQINSIYQLQVLKAGRYKIFAAFTNNSTSNECYLHTSAIGTGSWVAYHSSTVAPGTQSTCVLETIIDITLGVNNFIQIRSGSAASFYRNSLVIEEIPQSYTVIQNTTINEFVNPPTSQMTYLAIKNSTSQ